MAEIGKDISKAKQLLENGEVVGIPTETVYGLAGNALNEDAILKIYSVKNRPKFDPLIAHTNSLDKIEGLVKEIPSKAYELTNAFWPGPLTILLNKKSSVPDLLTSGLDRVAVRIPDHPLTLELLSALEFPLAAPSANPFGYVSPTSAQHVEDQLGDKIPYILDGGPCHIGLESTIVGFDGDDVVVYRLGGTKVEAIEEIVGKVKIQVNESSNPAAPGMLKSHYSPGRKMIIGDISENLRELNPETTGILSFMTTYDIPVKNQVVLSPTGDLDEAARNIFSALRKMDQPNIEVILTEFLPQEGLGKAINDRLRRAAV
ncbi:L-threonylcarbamoyladenylate synthase [Ekhidna sp. MALMAid0563]|uniref:L-threonylcarbamoyladenylate synthase n=1 Tax=Ekhidna sp. MALMAid0563 TaxID=3143937 RepID=UPI0032DF8A6C